MKLGDINYNSSRYWDRIERLKKRRNYLWNRIRKAEDVGKDLNYDKMEASALDWVIWIFETYDFTEETIREKQPLKEIENI